MNCLLLIDKPNWAYHRIADAIKKHNKRKNLKLKIMAIKKNEKAIKQRHEEFDRVLVMGWQTFERVSFLPKNKTLVGIHSHHSFDNRQTTPDRDVDPPANLVEWLSGFAGVNAVSRRLYDLFRRNGLENVQFTPNGVDTEMFRPQPGSHDRFCVGYSGSKAHDWRKGVTKYILPAAKRAGVRCEIAMLSSDKHVALENMPDYYRGIDAYICASLSEGFSLSVLEAAACGKPVISTRVGGCVELIRDGHNGFLVDRDPDAIADRIGRLRDDPHRLTDMGKNMRRVIEDEYCWSKKARCWLDFIQGANS